VAHTLFDGPAVEGHGEIDVPGNSGFTKSKIIRAIRPEYLCAFEVGCAAFVTGVVRYLPDANYLRRDENVLSVS